MFRSRTRKIFRDIWARKGRTVLVTIAIFIGVVGVVTLISAGDLMLRQLRKDLQPDKLGMIRAFVTVPKGASVDNIAYMQSLQEMQGVTAVQGNVIMPLSWKIPGDTEYNDGVIRSFSQPLSSVQLEPPRLMDGRFPVDGNKEVAVEYRMAQKYKLKVGDPIMLRILGGSTGAEFGEETWTISGILFHSYTFMGTSGPVPNDSSVYANYEDARYISGFTGYSSIYARYKDYPTAKVETDTFLGAPDAAQRSLDAAAHACDHAALQFAQRLQPLPHEQGRRLVRQARARMAQARLPEAGAGARRADLRRPQAGLEEAAGHPGLSLQPQPGGNPHRLAGSAAGQLPVR